MVDAVRTLQSTSTTAGNLLTEEGAFSSRDTVTCTYQSSVLYLNAEALDGAEELGRTIFVLNVGPDLAQAATASLEVLRRGPRCPRLGAKFNRKQIELTDQ